MRALYFGLCGLAMLALVACAPDVPTTWTCNDTVTREIWTFRDADARLVASNFSGTRRVVRVVDENGTTRAFEWPHGTIRCVGQ